MAVRSRGTGYSVATDPRVWIFGAVVFAALIATGALNLTNSATVANPFDIPIALTKNQMEWTVTTTIVAVILTGVVVGFIAMCWWLIRYARGGKSTISREYTVAAGAMKSPKTLKRITEKEARAKGKRLVPALDGKPEQAGIKLGTTLSGGRPIFLDWESTMLVVAGPRMGKTTAVAMPAMLTAPGAIVATSNKPDIYDDTCDYRATRGNLWLFDPQRVTSTSTNFWWNPLARVHDVPTALKLTGWLTSGAGISATANQSNKYFQDEGEKLLACLILASALGKGDLKHVYDWLKDIQSKVPVMLLREHGFHDPAADIEAIQSMESRQRDGVIGFARQPVGLLNHTGFAQFVTPPKRVRFGTDDSGFVTRDFEPGIHTHKMSELDMDAFATSNDTLYALSREGIDSAAGLVTALCGETFERAVEVAGANGGRLPVPMVAVLDEICNVCKLSEIPQVYSHWGSRGLIPISIIQSPAQAKGVWGAEGWDALKSAAAVTYYGGSVTDEQFLGELSKMIGSHDVIYTSRSSGSGSTSHSRSVQRETIMEIDALAALDDQLAVLQSPGNHPVLIRKNHFFKNKQLLEKLSAAKQGSEQ